MVVIRDGIIARAGIHTRADGTTEVVTAEELKRAIQIQPRIPLIIGPHPTGGMMDPQEIIGTVTQKWNDAEQRVDGEFWFYDKSKEERKRWLSIPKEIRDRISSDHEKVTLSACYQIGRIDDGVQVGRIYNHLSLGVEDPMHKDVGVNVRMETELPENYRIETESEISEVPSEREEPKPREASGLDELKEQVSQLTELVKSMIPSPPAEMGSSEEKATEEVLEAPPEPTPQEPKVEPEKVIAPSTAPSEDDYPLNDDMVAASKTIFGEEIK